MKNFEETIADFENYNLFPMLFEHGYTPDTIKQAIITSFDKYFNNKINLNSYAIDGLSATWLSYLTLSKHKHLIEKLYQTSLLMRKAVKQDSDLSVKAYLAWSDYLNDVTNKYWSVKNLAADTSSLCIEDMVEASFQMLGQLIEGLIKPYLKFIHHLYLISNQISTSKLEIEQFDLGKSIKDLTSWSNDLLLAPHGISFNQWRNISYHHNYNIEGGKINCTYGRTNNLKRISLTRKELLDIIELTYSSFKVFKISESFFLFDNLQTVQKYFISQNKSDPRLRDESRLIGIHSAISSQGFSVKSLIVDKKKTTLVIQDCLDDDAFKRGIHSSQFLHILWRFSEAENIEVTYKQLNGSEYLISKIKGSVLELYDKGTIELDELISFTQFDFVGDEKIKNDFLNKVNALAAKRDPFKIHLISAIPTEEKYYSQSGEQIPIKQFARDFTMVVFMNYLVFRELNYKTNDIKVNVGSDGAMVKLEADQKIILIVPAILKEKFVQQILMICINEIISLFEKKILIEELIQEAKDKKEFGMNIKLIKDYLNNNVSKLYRS